MPTVLRETLRCCITHHCVVRLGLIMSWPRMFLFGSAILHANNPLKNVSSESVPLCKKAAPFHFIQALSQFVLSTLIGNFVNKLACFSRLVSHPIAKRQWENTTLRESDCSFRLFSNSWDWYKTPAKNLNKFCRIGRGSMAFRPHSGCASELAPSVVVHSGVTRGGGQGPGRYFVDKKKFWKEFKISNSSLLPLNKVLNGITLFSFCV